MCCGAPVGPQTVPVDLTVYAHVFYVDQTGGNDAGGDGSRGNPWASLAHALEMAGVPAAPARVAVLVSQGCHDEPPFVLKPGVDLYGGFAKPGGVRDIFAHPTILDGAGNHRIAFGADAARVDGFQFVRGRVRGKGAALFCDGVSPTITNCVFTLNRTLRPEPWAPALLHETAHDGGAIFCTNGAAPRIENCLFYDNTTECGRGGALACDRHAAPRIIGNVFANNRAGLDDPMRSSDGGAISFFNWCGGELTGNVIVANTSLARNDAGGVFVALWSAPRITDNVIVANESGDDAGGLFIGGQEHRYGAALDGYPPADRFNVLVKRNVFAGNLNHTRNSGAMRVTMESRVRFTDNVIAENAGGFYLQRSEITAERNTVWQDWRFVEDKPSLAPSRLAGNILKGPLDGRVEARATMEHNMAEPGAAGADALAVADVFLNDGVAGRIAGLRFDGGTFTTIVTTAGALPAGTDYAGRPVRLGEPKNGQWRVIKHAADREIVLWGRLEAETKSPEVFDILRTFRLKPGAPAGVGARVK